MPDDVTADDVMAMVRTTYQQLAETLSRRTDAWDHVSLCTGWRVREVVAHVTMPARFTPAQFGAEIAAVGGDFGKVSNLIAARDSSRPIADQLADLRSTTLHDWQPPGGGEMGALNHAVVHSLDITVPLGVDPATPYQAQLAILDNLVRGGTANFGVDPAGHRFRSTDLDWSHSGGDGDGDEIAAAAGELIALLAGRTLPNGLRLPTVSG